MAAFVDMLALLKRYRADTPLGNQPHMIAAEADAVIAAAEAENPLLIKLLNDEHIHLLMGGEEWSLTEEEELALWAIIDDVKVPS